MSGVIAIVGAAVVVAGVGVSAQQGHMARKEQRAANRRAQQIEDVKGQRSRIEALRAARIQAAQVQAQAAGSGVGAGSSGVAGGIGSLNTQTAANIGFANQIDALNKERMQHLDTAARREGGVQIGQGISSIGSAIGGLG